MTIMICLMLLTGCGGAPHATATVGPETRFATLTWSQWFALTPEGRQRFIGGLLNAEFGGCPAVPPAEAEAAMRAIHTSDPASGSPSRVLAAIISGAGCTPRHR